MNLQPEGSAARCREAVARLEADRAVSRIWSFEASFWKIEAVARKAIESALGWLTVADRIAPTLPELTSFASEARQDADRVVILGMGGSSLAPLVFARTFGAASGYPELEVLDSTEPGSVAATAARSDPARTIFVVSSKSGTTLEPNIFFDFFFDQASRELGEEAGRRFVVVTDPGSALEKEAVKRRARKIFAGDPQIGGRYAALSTFGLVPAALLGLDVGELVSRARRMTEACRAPGAVNPGLLLGAAIGAEALSGRDKLTLSIGAPADRFGLWIEQLVAESTGKDGKGIVPVEGEELGGPEVYGEDRLFVRYDTKGREDAEALHHLATLVEHGHPLASFVLQDPLDLGAEMFRWEFATAVAGKILGVNPFDQPNVQEAKDRTNALLAGAGAPGTTRTAGPQLPELLSSIRAGDYFAITAYLPESPETDAALRRIRLEVRDAKKVATTVGYGPRFLHATGQLHKGGGENGVFLQITSEPSAAVAIPGRPWGFGDVLAAQAAGDFEALDSLGRRVSRVHLGCDVSSGLRQLSAAVGRALHP